MEKTLILLRGLPGAGKTTFAKMLGGTHIEADMYFEHPIRGYKFERELLEEAHAWCLRSTENCMSAGYHNVAGSRIVVSNTFTQVWEMHKYFGLAKRYGYRVFPIVVENRHDGINCHNVPEETIEKMRNRFEIKL